MSVRVGKSSDHVQQGTVIYTADYESDIQSLPTTCTAGSTCFCIETSTTYILNNKGEWKVKSTAGGGGEARAYPSADGRSFPLSNDNVTFTTSSENYNDIAKAIQEKTGDDTKLEPGEMADAITSIGVNAQFVLENVYHPKQFLCPWINLWENTTRGWEIEFNITRDSGAILFNICNRMYTGSANKGFLLEAYGNGLRFSGNNCGFGVFTVPFTDGKTYKIRRNYNEPTNMYIYEDGVLIHTEDQMEIYTDYATPFNFFGNSGNTADPTTYQPGTINSFKFKFLES